MFCHGNTKRRYLFFSLSLGKPASSVPDNYESDDDLLQNALEESLRFKKPENSPTVFPKRPDNHKSIVSSKINTFDTFKHNEHSSDDDDDDEGN